MSRHDLTRCVSFIILITLVLVTLRLASSLAREREGDTTSAVPFDRSRMLRHLAHQVMSPTYTAFATAVHELNRTTTPFCDAPTAVHLATLQDAWRRAVALWQRSAAFRLGPASAVASSIDFWPTRPRLIEPHLASSQPLTAAFLASVGSAARGLPAIEYLLFDPIGGSAAVLKRFQEGPGAKSRCTYLKALVEQVGHQADVLAQVWRPNDENFVAELTTAGRGSKTYTTVHSAVSDVVNHMLMSLENMRNKKLRKPMIGNGISPWPKSVEAWRSGNSLANLLENLRGLSQVYTGVYDTTNGPGFDEYLAAIGASQLAQRITQQLEIATQAVRDIPPPLWRAIRRPPPSPGISVVRYPPAASNASEALKTLVILLKVEMTNVLSITVDFSDNDGD